MAQTESVKRSSSKSRKNNIGGFYIDKIDGDVMRKYITKKKLDIDTEDVTDEQIGVALFSHFNENVADEDKVKCDNCDGISSDKDESCPYCGDSGEVEDAVETASEDEEDAAETSSDDEDEEEEPMVKTESKKEEDSDEDEEEDEEEEDEEEEDEEEEDEEEEDEEEPIVKTKSKKEEDSDEEDRDEEREEVTAAPTVKKRGRPKGSKNKSKETKKMDTTHVNGVNKKSNGLAKVVKGGLVPAKELDKAVAEVFKIRETTAENFWMLGKKLAEINKKQLWKQRVDENGKQRYKGFDAFVHAELNMTPQHAYSAIDLAKNYEDAQEVRELGHTKAAMILKAAPEDRQKLKAKAKAGATKRELAKEVKESRQKHSVTKGNKKAEAGAKGAAARAKKIAARAEKISIAAIEGTKTIKLYKKPETLRGFDPKSAARATSLKDGPFGFFEMANGVMQYYHVFVKDGALVMKVQTIRQSTEE